MILAFFSFFSVVGTTDKLHDPPDEDNKSNYKGELDERVDNSPVDTEDYFIKTLGISYSFEHEERIIDSVR